VFLGAIMTDANHNTSATLAELRQQIDELDRAIQKLVSDRAVLAQQVGKEKLRSGQSTVGFYRPEREAQILREVVARNEGPLKDDEIMRVFREIISACLAQEEPLKVAYLGPEGTFTQSAVYKQFGHSVRAMPVGAIADVFNQVESGGAEYGVVPIENSTEGTVNHTLDMFMTSALKICGEVELRVRQHLLSKTADIASIKKVYSHPQSIAQCRAWLNEYLPGAELIEMSSNAQAAQKARDEAGAAAIAGDAAAEVYELQRLVTNIEDQPDNTTRFLVIGHQSTPASGDDRTSLLLSTADTEDSGALYRLLQPLADSDISMTRIESRPSKRRKWHYVFFVDIDGHADDPHVAEALAKLEQSAGLFQLLGSYPKAVL
jgi:chorismate mutase/prephenate dehydratase